MTPAAARAAFPAPRLVDTGAVRLAVYERGEGLPVILCHGIPEIAYSWRHQLPALAAAGYRAIAVDQCGHGRSDCPTAVRDYDVHHLTGDLVRLMDVLDIERAVLCGHDSATMTVQRAVCLHPDRFVGLIGVTPPFMPPLPEPPVTLMRRMYGDRHQFVAFQQPDVPEAILGRDVAHTLRRLLRTNLTRASAAAAGFPRILDVVQGAVTAGDDLLAPEDLAVYVEAFTRTGFAPCVHWFRNLDHDWATTRDLDPHLRLPVLYIRAEHGDQMPPGFSDLIGAYAPDYEQHTIPDCGHWTQQERPEAVNALLLDWLRRKFPC